MFLPILIRNFPRIPKITLRKSYDKFKAKKNIDSKNFDKFFSIFVTFRDVLDITTLYSMSRRTNFMSMECQSYSLSWCRDGYSGTAGPGRVR